jgi:hypothetical protein
VRESGLFTDKRWLLVNMTIRLREKRERKRERETEREA